MVAIALIVAVVEIIPLYSPGGASVHLRAIEYAVPLAYASLPPFRQHLDRFIRFCRARQCAERTDKHKPIYVTTSVAIARIPRYACDAG